MWTQTLETLNDDTNRIVRRSRSRMYLSSYRMRNPLDAIDLAEAFAWVAAPAILEQNATGMRQVQLVVENVTRTGETEVKEAALKTSIQETLRLISDAKASWEKQNVLRINMINITSVKATYRNVIQQIIEECTDVELEEMQWRAALTLTVNTVVSVFRIKDTACYYVLTNNIDINMLRKLSGLTFEQHKNTTDVPEAVADKLITALLVLDSEMYAKVFDEEYVQPAVKERKKIEFKEKVNTQLKKLTQARTLIYKNRVLDRQSDITRYENTINDLEEEILSLREKIAYATLNAGKSEEELNTLLVSMYNMVDFINTNDNRDLYLVMTTPLLYFDKKSTEAMLNASNSNLSSQSAWLRTLIKAIFVDETAQLIITSGFKLSAERASVSYMDPTNVLSCESIKGIPNPHHKYYDCWGDNKVPIRRALEKDDWCAAIMQAYAALGAINVLDSAVFNRLLSALNTDTYVRAQRKAIFIKRTGTYMSVQQFNEKYVTSETEKNKLLESIEKR